MPLPFHPMIVHFPIALSVILPLLTLIFAFLIKTRKMNTGVWAIIIGLHLFTVATGYIALESGETEEETVQRVVAKEEIAKHEKYAEIFVGITVVATVFSIVAFFVTANIQFYVQLANVIILLVGAFYAFETGEHGGDLVYRYGAPRAYELNMANDVQLNILPTPGMNTSESEFPVNEENESLKVDDNDYGNENGEVDEEVEKLED